MMAEFAPRCSQFHLANERASEPRERSEATTRRARGRVGEPEGRSPSE